MRHIKFHWLALVLCVSFSLFALGYYLGGQPQRGTYTIVTESVPDAPPLIPSTEPHGDMRINVNTATIEELTDLPGIGPALGQRIVDYREENGPFSAPEDLIGVSGIGPKILEDILPFIKIGD